MGGKLGHCCKDIHTCIINFVKLLILVISSMKVIKINTFNTTATLVYKYFRILQIIRE